MCYNIYMLHMLHMLHVLHMQYMLHVLCVCRCEEWGDQWLGEDLSVYGDALREKQLNEYQVGDERHKSD